MGLSPFKREFGTEQGRVEPDGFAPSNGDFVFVLGHDQVGHEHVFNLGDELRLNQTGDYPVGSRYLRVRCRARPPGRLPMESLAEPYALIDGETLEVSVDGATAVEVVFNTAEFVAIGTARAYEVAKVIRDAIPELEAYTKGNTVLLVSRTTGRAGSISIAGGTAETKLDFKGRAWKIRGVTTGAKEFASRILAPGNTRDFEWVLNLALEGGSVNLEFYLTVVET